MAAPPEFVVYAAKKTKQLIFPSRRAWAISQARERRMASVEGKVAPIIKESVFEPRQPPTISPWYFDS